jgi:hypothetical protein
MDSFETNTIGGLSDSDDSDDDEDTTGLGKPRSLSRHDSDDDDSDDDASANSLNAEVSNSIAGRMTEAATAEARLAALSEEIAKPFSSLNIEEDGPNAGSGGTGNAVSDPRWVHNRNVKLLSQLLALSTPIVNDKMVAFMEREDVIETLLKFIHLCNPPDGLDENNVRRGSNAQQLKSLRKYSDSSASSTNSSVKNNENGRSTPTSPGPAVSSASAASTQITRRYEAGDDSEELQLSYKAAKMLGDESPSPSLTKYMKENTDTIIRELWKAFSPYSQASFHHVCLVLTKVTTAFPEKVLEVIGRNASSVNRHITPMLDYIEHEPVATYLAMLINLYTTEAPTVSKQLRWKYVRALSDMRILLALGNVISNPESPFLRVETASDIFLSLFDNMCTDENAGELLLQPLGHCPELVTKLLSTACDTSLLLARRTCCAAVLTNVASRAREKFLPAPGGAQFAGMAGEGMPKVLNKMNSTRELFFKILNDKTGNLKVLCGCLLLFKDPRKQQASASSENELAVAVVGGTGTAGRSPDTLINLRHPGRIVIAEAFTGKNLISIHSLSL